MHLTDQQLRDLGYVYRNGELHKVSRSLSHTQPQRNEAPALGGPVEGEAQGMGRIGVRFTLYRQRLLDPDNAAGSVKDLLDGLRRAALIPEDDWHTIALQVEQVKCKRAEERTVVEVGPITKS